MKAVKKNTRLTKQHWLNIMIISVSAMLLISVLVGRMLNNQEFIENDHNRDIKIVQIDFQEIQFSLVDGVWICSEQNFQHMQIIEMVKHWEALLLKQGEPINHKSVQGKTILLYLERMSMPIIAKIHLNNDNMKISFISAKQEFDLESSLYPNYYPQIMKLN